MSKASSESLMHLQPNPKAAPSKPFPKPPKLLHSNQFNMDALFLSFANSETHPLDSLRTEDDKANAILGERVARGDFILIREQYASREKIVAALRQYRNDICLFWYSGHAGSDQLLLEDGVAQAAGIAALLGDCPNLKLVALNGCSTEGQVKALIENGIPMVISTTAPVNDEIATQFSGAFFTELSKNGRSVREAFNMAADTAKVFGKIETAVRSAGRQQERNSDKPLWELIIAEKDADLPDTWRLPEKEVNTPANQYIRQVLTLLYEEQLKAIDTEGAPQDILLKRLPFTISEPIRKLLAPGDNSGQVFYDRPSPERYRMLLYAYQSIVNFVVYALLSQLWKEKPAITVAATIKDDFRQWLLSDFRQTDNQSMMPFLRRLVEVFKQNKIPLFFPELEASLATTEQPGNRDAFEFLEKQLAAPAAGNSAALCDQTEQYLAVVLYCFGFLVQYSLTSVKNIGVLNYMHDPEPRFENHVVRLQQQMTALDDRSENSNAFLKTAAIQLRHISDAGRILYLSPFLIDENAYTHTPKANLRYFAAYDKTNRYFHFKQVSKPEDVLRIEQKQISALAKIRGEAGDANDYYSLIYGQFSAFCQSVFGKNLDEL